MNFNIVNPSGNLNQSSNLIQNLIMSKSNPLHSFTMNETINAYGTVSGGAENQITPNSPMAMLNPQLNGPMNLPSVIQTRKTVMTKYDNKRRDTIDQIALFDWRNNTSLNNSTRVPANYYQEQLTKNAKDKVRTKQMMEGYSTQFAGDIYSEFSDQAIDKATSKQDYTTNEFKKKDLGYVLDYGNPNAVQVPSYNPLLRKSQSNRPIDDPSYADERLTHNFSDRPYTTKGDRQLQAREIATSQMMKERRQLQAESEQAMYGTVKAPRKDNPNIGMGIKTQYFDDVNTNVDFRKDSNDTIKNIKSAIDISTSNKPHLFRNESEQNQNILIDTAIQQQLDLNDEEVKEYYREHWQSKPDLNLYSGRSSDLTKQRSKLQQQQQLDYENILDEERIRIFKKNYRDNIHGDVYENDYESRQEGFISMIVEGFKNFFNIGSKKEDFKEHSKRKYKSDEEYEEELKHKPYLYEDNDIIEFNKHQHRHKYWVIKDDTKFEFDNDLKRVNELIKEPISLLTDGEKIYRTMVVREVDSIKIHQREEDLETGEVKFNVMNVPIDFIQDDILKKAISLENRHNVEDNLNNRYEDVLDLDYENHILMANIMDEGPDDWKIESKSPITYHHRAILSDEDEIKNNVVTNIPFIEEYIEKELEEDINFKNYFVKHKDIDPKYIVNLRGDFEEHKHTLIDPLEFDYSIDAGSELKQGIKQGIKDDPRNITKRFNAMM